MNNFYKQLIFITLGVAIITVGGLGIYAVANRGANPVLWLKMDEGYASTTYDASGNSNTGTITNANWANEEQCKFGKCLFFDGETDYVTVSDSASIDASTGVTLQAWIRTNALNTTSTLIEKDSAYSLDISQGMPRFRAYANSVWHTVQATGRAIAGGVAGWLFREPADGTLTGSGGATFTPGFGYRTLAPSSLTSEKGILITQSDNLQYTRGSQATPDGTNVVYENFNPNQGTLEFWVRPNWDYNDGALHYIFGARYSSNNYIFIYKSADNELSFSMRSGGSSTPYSADYSLSAGELDAGTWHHIVFNWDVYKVVEGSDYARLYLDGAKVAADTTQIDGPADVVFTNFHIGSDHNTTYQFNGTITGRILNRPISSSTVNALYNDGAGHTDTFTVTPDTVWMGTYSDSTTTAAYWHTGKYVSAVADGSTEDQILTSEGSDNSFANNDRIVVYDGTGYKVEGCVDGTPTSTSVFIDDCAGADPGTTEKVGVNIDADAAYYAQAAANTVHDITTDDISVSAWVKVDSDAGASVILSKMQSSNNYYELRVISSGELRLIINDEGAETYELQGNTNLIDDKWHHVTVIVDRNSAANSKIFLDGYEDGTTNKTGTLGSVVDITNTGTLTLGARSTDVSSKFDGQIRDVKLYYAADSIWTDAQVLYQATHPFDYSASAGTLTDYWQGTDGATDTSTTTVAGNVNNLTLSNSAAWSQEAFVSKNLIPDSGMENGGIGLLDVHTGDQTLSKDSTVKYDAQAYKMIGGSSGWEYTLMNVTTAAGEDYLYRQYGKIGTGGDNGYTAILDSGNSTIVSQGSFGLTTTYALWETAFEAVDATTKIQSTIYEYDTAYFDQIQLLPNLVDNGGMEGIYDDESGGGGGTVNVAPNWANWQVETDDTDELDATTTIIHSGSKSQLVDVDGASEGVIQTGITVISGDWYTVSAWVYVISGTVKLSGGDAFTSTVTYNTAGSWQKLSFTEKAGSASANIAIGASGAGVEFYVDDVSLIKLDTVPASTVSPSSEANSFNTGKWDDSNGAFLVDGTDVLTYPTSGNIGATGTLAFWIKPNGWNYTDGLVHQLFDGGSNDMTLMKHSENWLGIYNADDSDYILRDSMPTDMTTSTWTHIVMTWDNGGTVLYTNGAQLDTGSAPSSVSWGANMTIGAYGVVNTQHADAYYDDIRIYNTVLTAAEIADLYAGSYESVITENQWSHLTGVYDKANENLHIYIDGVLKKTTAVGGSYDLNNSSDNLVIGEGFSGYMDNIKVFDEPRTASQIRTDFIAGQTARGASGRSVTVGESTDNTEGLVAYWNLNEQYWNPSAASILDSSGNNNHLTSIADATSSATSTYGRAATFDGTGDYLCSDPDNDGSCEDDDNLDMGTSDFTIEAWVKHSMTTNPGLNSIISKKASPDNNSLGISVGVKGSGTAQMFKISDGSSSLSANDGRADLNDDQWHHWVFVFDRDANAIRYVDGVQNGSVTNISSFKNVDFSNADHFRVGYDLRYFTGQIDDVKIYNVARTASQIRKDYETGPPPVAHWKFDDKDDTYAYDTAGSNDGTLNFDENAATSTKWVSGKYGSALQFDGVDDYVDAGTDSSLDLDTTKTFTVSAWVKVSNIGVRDEMIVNHRGTDQCRFEIGTVTGFMVCYSDSDASWSGGTSVSSDIIDDNQWHHVVWHVDSGVFSFYRDGIKQGQSNLTYDMPNIDGQVTLAEGSGSAEAFEGLMDDVRIYNYARTQKQIMEDMNAGHPAVGSPVGSYVGYWKFDEGYASTTYDQSVNNNDGTLTGGVQWTQSGKFGTALQFDGINDYMTIPDDSSLEPTSISVSVWIYLNSSADGSKNSILQKGTTASGGNENGFAFQWRGDEVGDPLRWIVVVGTNTKLQLDTANVVATGQWHHIVGSYDPALSIQNQKVYVDGVLVNTDNNTNAIDYTGTPQDFRLGSQAPIITNPFDGMVDEVKIYPFALTPEEVKQEYDGGATLKLGSLSAPPTGGTGAGTSTDSASIEYCVPGDTAQCDPPIAHWKFDEGTGSTMYDTAGSNDGALNLDSNSLHATSNAWQPSRMCHSGSCLSFDGTNDYVNMGDQDILDVQTGSSITIEAWINPADISGAEIFVAKNDLGRYYYFFAIDDAALRFKMRDNVEGNFINFTEGTLSAGNWYHVAAVKDVANLEAKIYVNGQLQGTPTSFVDYNTNNSDNFYIGANAGSSDYFEGQIDDVRIYNYARTPAQIAWEYNRGAPIGWWKMDEGQDTATTCNATGATVYDYSGNSNNGTLDLSHSPATSTAWTEGKYSCALDFDGTDDYVEISDPSGGELDFGTGDFSYSVWLKVSNDDGGYPTILRKGTGAGGNARWGLSIDNWLGNDGILYTHFTDAEGTTVMNLRTTDGYNDGNWHHVLITFTNGGNAKLYIDNKLKDTLDVSSLVTMNSAESLYFGQISSDNYLEGTIDDVRIYNYALTESQIRNVYNEGSAVRFGPSSGLP